MRNRNKIDVFKRTNQYPSNEQRHLHNVFLRQRRSFRKERTHSQLLSPPFPYQKIVRNWKDNGNSQLSDKNPTV
jgi:hypothetical protein